MKRFVTKQTVSLLLVTIVIIGSISFLLQPQEGVACTYDEGSLYSLTYADENGNCQTLEQYKAPVVVINAWASWCPFCVEELPDLALLADEFPEVPVIAINRGESSADAQDFLKTLTLSDKLHILFDPQDSFYRFIEGFGMPETVFVDEEGTVLFHKRGVMSLQEMRDTILLLTKRSQPNGSTKSRSLCLGGEGTCSI
ncbi:TlpA family protein disulfide reductase [Candidatus Kaiserbacteria bacterium]|nr:MAG: TlpA family protein disulfide reductase [Candidatus Kaiserbacteria bacterium]